MQEIIDYTTINKLGSKYPTKVITLKNGLLLRVFDIPQALLLKLHSVVYVILHRDSQKPYIGITDLTLGVRWNGVGYKPEHQHIGRALQMHGEEAFDKYVVAFSGGRKTLERIEKRLIRQSGGHKTTDVYNMTGGADVVSDIGKPVVGLNLETNKERHFISASLAGRKLDIYFSFICGIANKMPSTKSATDKNGDRWWFRWADDIKAKPPEFSGRGSGGRLRRKWYDGYNYTTKAWRSFEGGTQISEELGVCRTSVTSIAQKTIYAGKRKLTAADRNGDRWWFRHRGEKSMPPELYGAAAHRLGTIKAIIIVPYADRRKRMPFESVVSAREHFGTKSTIDAVARGEQASFRCKDGNHYWAMYADGDIKNMPKTFGHDAVAKKRGRAIIATHIHSKKKHPFTSLKETADWLKIDNRVRVWKAINHNRLIGNYSFEYAL